MKAPSPLQLEAIARIAARPEGKLIYEYLKSEMDSTLTLLVATNDPQLTRVVQGEARVLDVLLKVWKP